MDQYPDVPTHEADESTEPTEPVDMVRDALERVKATSTAFVTEYAKQPEEGDFETSPVYQQRVERDAQYERLGLEVIGSLDKNDQVDAVYNATLAYVLDPTTKRFARPNDGGGSVVINITPMPGSDTEKRVAEALQLGTDSERAMISIGFIPNEERLEINGVSADNKERVLTEIEIEDASVPREIAQLVKELADNCVEQFKAPIAVRETKRFMS